MTFNPNAYAKTSYEAAQGYENRKKWREENAHLALPFFVEGLRNHVPPVFPGEMVMIGAPSGHGKSTIMRAWHNQAQAQIEEQKRSAVTIFGSQEETTEQLIASDMERNPSKASSLPSVYIGNSFGMNADQMDDLHMTNFINTIHYVRNEKFAEKMDIANIWYDYQQATPNDPYRKNHVTDDSYRHQLADNVRRLYQCRQTFRCPIVTASQTSLKKVVEPYHADIPIPGPADYSESSAVYQVPDFVYSFLLMRTKKPVGTWVETDTLKFQVKDNLVFFWFLKARGHKPETAKGISRVFPLLIENDEYIYDAEYHKSILI